MADDGDRSTGAVDTSGGQRTSDESDGFSLGGMLLNLSILVLVVTICYVIYRRWGKRIGADAAQGSEASSLPKMRRRDFTLEQLGEYDGLQNPRIMMAVNMKVFDVTTGKKFYGRAGQVERRAREGCFNVQAVLGVMMPVLKGKWADIATDTYRSF